MSRLKKILLLVLVLVLISQSPFAYRRYRLGRLNAAIQSVNAGRAPLEPGSNEIVREYKGVIHVHSFLGGHSAGTFQQIIAGAKTNKLDFVIMTEHVESSFDTSALTLSGIHDGVLFVNGNEVEASNGDRILSIPGSVALAGSTKKNADEVFSNNHGRNALSIIAYPEQFKSSLDDADGIEVYNVFTNARNINWVVALFDSLWSHHSYPDLLFTNYLQRPDENLDKWDQAITRKKLVALAGNDSHSNIGITLNDSSGNELLGLKLDPYETSFRLVRVHVLVTGFRQPLESSTLLSAIRDGHCFLGFDMLGDTTGFRFEALNSTGTKIQGDEISFRDDTRLKVTSPVSCRIVIFKDGKIAAEESGVTTVEWKVPERGTYRVETYLPQLGEPIGKQPWIISNPIYVR